MLTRTALKLSHDGAMVLMVAAIKAAEDIGVPQCIAVVDEGCNLLAFIRMDGARVLSVESSKRKAMTAATTGLPTGGRTAELAVGLAQATDGRMTNLLGGLPIIIEGQVVGGIGIGSGTGEQDLDIAHAAIAAFEAALKRA
jgi:glc operon protein GlcG